MTRWSRGSQLMGLGARFRDTKSSKVGRDQYSISLVVSQIFELYTVIFMCYMYMCIYNYIYIIYIYMYMYRVAERSAHFLPPHPEISPWHIRGTAVKAWAMRVCCAPKHCEDARMLVSLPNYQTNITSITHIIKIQSKSTKYITIYHLHWHDPNDNSHRSISAFWIALMG